MNWNLHDTSCGCTIAIVGAGRMAREHIRAFDNVPGVRIAGICSRTRGRAEVLAKEFAIPYTCNSIAELHSRTGAELVVVAVPVSAMGAVGMACLEHSWRLLVEKPPAQELGEAEVLNRAAQEWGRQVFVGLNRRFLSSTQAAVAALQDDQGHRHIHVLDRQNLQEAAAAGHPEIVVRHWMYANSIHLVDYLTLFGRGEVVAVTPVLPWYQDAPPPAVIARIDFSSGDTGIYEGIWQGPGPWGVTVTTPQQRWELRPLEQAESQLQGERVGQAAEVSDWDILFKPGFRQQAEEVVKALRGGNSKAITLDEALKTMRLTREIYGV